MLIEGYDIFEKVGEGGAATVWKARQKSLNRLVAVKLMTDQQDSSSEGLVRFRLEAESAARLNHPGIVQIYDAGEMNASAYLVMEFIDGHSLEEVLRDQGPFKVADALRIARDVAEAMSYAWTEARMVHCDIKPGNILIARDGRVTVSDLGVARMLGQASDSADRDMITGTPHYSSPEQTRGEPLDARSDIYSLGATLYHMVTGQMPFKTLDHEEALAAQGQETLPDPIELNRHVSSEMAWLLEKMMVWNRTDRVDSWEELLADIDKTLRGEPLDSLPAKTGLGAIERSERRKKPSRKAQTSTAATPATSGSAPRMKVKKGAVPSSGVAGSRVSKKKRESPLRAALQRLMFLGVLTASAYVLYWYADEHTNLLSRENWGAPDRGDVASVEPEADAPDTQPSARSSASRSASSEPSFDDPATGSTGNPGIRRARALLNRARSEYAQFLEDQEQSRLDRVEELARDGLDRLERMQKTASGDRASAIREAIRSGYQIIFNARQSRKLDLSAFESGNTSESSASTDSARTMPRAGDAIDELFSTPSTPPARTTEPTPPVAPEPSEPAGYQSDGLALHPDWNAELDPEKPPSRDLVRLLQAYGSPEIALEPASDFSFPNRIGYLMPIQQAMQALQARPVDRRLVTSPVFPQRSLVELVFEGRFEDDFTELSLIADRKGQVAAVALGYRGNLPAIPRLPRNLFSSTWSVDDVLTGDTKDGNGVRIAHRVSLQEDGVVIDSESVDANLRPRTVRRLYLPSPMVDLLLARNLPPEEEEAGGLE